jgi:hypothetical protein
MTVPSADILAVLAPLVVGVTGHRDLRPEDLEELKKQVREILNGLRTQYPSTPIILLSPLAEGADRLAASVALEDSVWMRLAVPLPMPQPLYEQDFQTRDLLAEFHRMLAQAKHRISIPMQSDEKEVARGGEARNLQYEAMGKRIARESQILIALWDGIDSGKVGGTAEIVKFQLHGVPSEEECDLQPPELFPVYRIVTPRVSNPNPEGQPFTLEKKYPDSFKGEDKKEEEEKKKEAEDYYHQLFRNLDEFNQQILNGESLKAKAIQSKRDLMPDFDLANLSPSEALDLERYAVADALAQRFQTKMQSMDKRLHWTVFFAFVCFIIFAHHETHLSFFLASSLGLLVIAYALVKWHLPHAKLDSKSQDYRAIAEGSRVRFFWRWAGISKSVAENYLGKQRTELDWIRNGLRGWELETHMAPPAGAPPRKDRLEKIRELWIDGQLNYFGTAAPKMEKKFETLERLKVICSWLSVTTAVVTLVALLITRYCPWDGMPREDCWLPGLIILLDISLIAAALLHHYIQQKAYPQHIKQFGRMKAVFTKAREIIDEKLQAGDPDSLAAVQKCLFKVGREALEENGDWVFLHRERPLELPPP